MVFTAAQLLDLSDDQHLNGHFDTDPMYSVLLTLHQTTMNGRLSVRGELGDSHMFFAAGRPVGVTLFDTTHPLGQLLLELGRVNGSTFVMAQRLIADGNRLPGQVYKELKVIDDAGLKEVLQVQSRRKAASFCALASKPFSFHRGLSFLQGFSSAPMDVGAVLYFAVRHHFSGGLRAAWLRAARDDEFFLAGALPVTPADVGFGPPEERFLQRLQVGYANIDSLAETGALPTDDIVVLLRYLEVFGVLKRRRVGSLPTPAPMVLPAGPAVIPVAPVITAPPAAPSHRGPAAVSGLHAAAALAEVSADDVFSRAKPIAPIPAPEPWLHALGDKTPPLTPVPVRRINDSALQAALNAPTPPEVQTRELTEELPVVRKKKVKRTEAMPSEGTGVLVGETRREKTNVKPVSSIVFDDDS
jgi:hypothetical protein